MFNNNVPGSLLKILKIHLFNEVNEEAYLPGPLSDHFLLNNDGEILFDNTNDPLLVE
jgi:hypothetical protein